MSFMVCLICLLEKIPVFQENGACSARKWRKMQRCVQDGMVFERAVLAHYQSRLHCYLCLVCSMFTPFLFVFTPVLI